MTTAALITLIVILLACLPRLVRRCQVNHALILIDRFLKEPGKARYKEMLDYCMRIGLLRKELPEGYYDKVVRVEEAMLRLRSLGREV